MDGWRNESLLLEKDRHTLGGRKLTANGLLVAASVTSSPLLNPSLPESLQAPVEAPPPPDVLPPTMDILTGTDADMMRFTDINETDCSVPTQGAEPRAQDA